jgi:uncharacterized protein YcfJ
MNSLKRLLLSAAVLCQVPFCARADSTAFYDYAPVVDVDPIMEQRYETVSRRVCDQYAPAVAAIAATIGTDVRLQDARWKGGRECRQVEEPGYRNRIAGYRVTYRYGGQKLVRRLSYDPGERVRVKVGLSPLSR